MDRYDFFTQSPKKHDKHKSDKQKIHRINEMTEDIRFFKIKKNAVQEFNNFLSFANRTFIFSMNYI